MPWCSMVGMNPKMVDSCPPCWVADDVMAEPTLPTSAPLAQSPPVWSMKLRICEAMVP